MCVCVCVLYVCAFCVCMCVCCVRVHVCGCVCVCDATLWEIKSVLENACLTLIPCLEQACIILLLMAGEYTQYRITRVKVGNTSL